MNRFGALRQLGAREGSAGEDGETDTDGLSGSLARAARAIDEVVAAAERAAEEVRSEAEKRARGKESVIDRDRVAAELMSSLAERTDALRAEAAELARILERAAPLLDKARSERRAPGSLLLTQGAGTVPGARVTHQTAPAGDGAAPEPASTPEADADGSERAPDDNAAGRAETQEEPQASAADGAGPSEGIRLLVTQMAVAGSSHAEIAARLRNEFAVEDADKLLAEVFGGGS